MHVLVTGGAGYIGSHTVVRLLELGYKVTVIDNFANSHREILSAIKQIANKDFAFFEADLRNHQHVDLIFKNSSFDAVIHLAALKSAPESVEKPKLYHTNNIGSLLNLVDAAQRYGTKYFIFSSSCAVYGKPNYLPVDEKHPFNRALSPYARTKQIAEFILEDVSFDDFKVISLRYFNPVGAHPSGQIGDLPSKSGNLMHYILLVALGKMPYLKIYGNDYNTPDGTGIRDYIYIMDVIEAHVKALERLASGQTQANYEFFNIGIGKGISVLEMVHAFEKYTGVKIPYKFVARRPGDVDAIYASATVANKILGWKAQYGLKEMILTSYNWAKKAYK